MISMGPGEFTPITLCSPRESTSPKFARAFSTGCGGVMKNLPIAEPLHRPIALFGSSVGWNQITAARESGRDWYYGDHAFLGARSTFYRISHNEFQYRGTEERDGARRFMLLEKPIRPWRKAGRDVLVCPAPAVHAALMGFDGHEAEKAMVAAVKDATDRPVVVRYKATATTPIASALADAWAVVTYHSNVAIDALIYGVPVFVLCPWAATRRMALADLAEIERPYYPDNRPEFCHALASHQWTMDEIAAGKAWRVLRDEAEATRARMAA